MNATERDLILQRAERGGAATVPRQASQTEARFEIKIQPDQQLANSRLKN